MGDLAAEDGDSAADGGTEVSGAGVVGWCVVVAPVGAGAAAVGHEFARPRVSGALFRTRWMSSSRLKNAAARRPFYSTIRYLSFFRRRERDCGFSYASTSLV